MLNLCVAAVSTVRSHQNPTDTGRSAIMLARRPQALYQRYANIWWALEKPVTTVSLNSHTNNVWQQ